MNRVNKIFMNRNIYKQIKTMRNSMDIWVSHAEQIVAGIPIQKKHKPVTQIQCEFGQWYLKLRPLLKDLQAYKRIKIHHESQHMLYLRIYNLICPYDACSIRCPSNNCSTIAKLSGKAANLREQRRDEARDLIPTLHLLNEQLHEMIDLLEEQIKKYDKTPAQRLAELSPKSEPTRKQTEVNYMLDTLDLRIN